MYVAELISRATANECLGCSVESTSPFKPCSRARIETTRTYVTVTRPSVEGTVVAAANSTRRGPSGYTWGFVSREGVKSSEHKD